MKLKGIGKRIGNMAFRLAMYSCGGECGKCGICKNPSPPISQSDSQSRENGIWVEMAKL